LAGVVACRSSKGLRRHVEEHLDANGVEKKLPVPGSSRTVPVVRRPSERLVPALEDDSEEQVWRSVERELSTRPVLAAAFLRLYSPPHFAKVFTGLFMKRTGTPKKAAETGPLITVKQAWVMLNIPRPTLYRWLKRYPLGRYGPSRRLSQREVEALGDAMSPAAK